MTIQDMVNKYGSKKRVAEMLDIGVTYIYSLTNNNKPVSMTLMKKIAELENLNVWEVVKANEEAGLI